MEPRPQSPRSAHDQPSRQMPAGSGRGPQETGAYQQQPDPTTVMAPPRSDYDYSPLDLAPPGQRRRRQLVAAGLGALVVLLLVAAMVFAYLVLREDDPDDETSDGIAAAQTEVAVSEATLAAQQTLVAEAVGDAETPEGEAGDATTSAPGGEEGGDAEGTTTVDEGADEAADAPSDSSLTDVVGAITGNGGGDDADTPADADLQALLPSQDVMPQGLTAGEDVSRTEAEVAAAIGGNREAETNLQEWGWNGNVERSFTAADPAALAPDATTDITVSLHGFADDASAADALVYFSDVLVALGYEEVEVGDIGATNRMLTMPQEDGGTTVALYVQQGPVLYRIGGYSPGGDPTTNVVNAAEQMLGGQ